MGVEPEPLLPTLYERRHGAAISVLRVHDKQLVNQM
jgi:hypothetical protein